MQFFLKNSFYVKKSVKIKILRCKFDVNLHFKFIQYFSGKHAFLPESVWAKGSSNSWVCHSRLSYIFTSSHLHIVLSSHLTSSHSHLHILTSSLPLSHTHIFTSSKLHTHIFTSSNTHIFSFSLSHYPLYMPWQSPSEKANVLSLFALDEDVVSAKEVQFFHFCLWKGDHRIVIVHGLFND